MNENINDWNNLCNNNNKEIQARDAEDISIHRIFFACFGLDFAFN